MSTVQQYPLLAEIKQAPGKGGKLTVRAYDVRTGGDITREIVYVTIQGAFKSKEWLLKVSEVDRWMRVPSGTTLAEVGTISTPTGKAQSASPIQGELDAKKAAAKAENDPILKLIHSSPQQRPESLICADLTWKMICRSVIRGRNIMLTGPTGTGKSQTAFAAAKAMGKEVFYINLGATQDPRGALIGNTHFAKDAGTFFNQSAFVTAIQTPNTCVVLDEISRAHPEAANILMTVLDPNQRYLRMDEQVGTPTIKVDPTVSFIATANIGSEYTATRVLDRALIDRFSIIEIPFLNTAQESGLVRQLFPAIEQEQAQNLAEIATATRAEVMGDSARITTPVSTRSVLEMAGLITDGFTLSECAEVLIYPLYSQEGGMQSERTFIKQLIQKYINDGTADNLMGTPAVTEDFEF